MFVLLAAFKGGLSDGDVSKFLSFVFLFVSSASLQGGFSDGNVSEFLPFVFLFVAFARRPRRFL